MASPCTQAALPAHTAASENVRRMKLDLAQHDALREMQRRIDAIPASSSTLSGNDLEMLGVSWAPMLNADDPERPTQSCAQRFFAPLDFPQDWLEYLSWSCSYRWDDMGVYADNQERYSFTNLNRQYCRCEWLDARVGALWSNLEPAPWNLYRDYLEIVDATGRYLASRRYRGRHFANRPQNFEYNGHRAWLAKRALDKPHAACLMIDSTAYVTDGVILRSELEAAICLIQHRLGDGGYPHHHTKPVLVITLLRGDAARVTQAHVDCRQRRLVVAQSRQLDLSGPEPGDDAWLLLRWLISDPVGLTRYPDVAAGVEGACGNRADMTPTIRVAHSANSADQGVLRMTNVMTLDDRPASSRERPTYTATV